MCDLKEFCYSIFRKWKVICVVAIISVIIGAVGSILPIKHSNGVQKNSKEISENSWFETEEVYVGRLKYVGISNGMIKGEEIRDIYLAKLFGDSFYQYIQLRFFEDESNEYVRNLISVTNGGLNTYCGIDILYYDKTVCKNIQEAIVEYIQEQKSVLENKIGPHQFILIDSNINKVPKSTYSEKISEIKSELKQEVVGEEKKVLSKKELIMNIILALILGEFLLCICILGRDGLKNRVYNLRNLEEKEGVDLLGDFSNLAIKNGIDKKIYNVFLGKQSFSKEGIAKIICFKLEQKFGRDKSYMIIGGCQEKILDEVLSVLKNTDNKKLTFSKGELIDESAQILNTWNIDTKVIYVVKRFRENENEIEKNIKLFKELGFDIAGVIFV